MEDFEFTKEEMELIRSALRQGQDVRIHPERYGLKILAEKTKVLSKRETIPDGNKTK